MSARVAAISANAGGQPTVRVPDDRLFCGPTVTDRRRQTRTESCIRRAKTRSSESARIPDRQDSSGTTEVRGGGHEGNPLAPRASRHSMRLHAVIPIPEAVDPFQIAAAALPTIVYMLHESANARVASSSKRV